MWHWGGQRGFAELRRACKKICMFSDIVMNDVRTEIKHQAYSNSHRHMYVILQIRGIGGFSESRSVAASERVNTKRRSWRKMMGRNIPPPSEWGRNKNESCNSMEGSEGVDDSGVQRMKPKAGKFSCLPTSSPFIWTTVGMDREVVIQDHSITSKKGGAGGGTFGVEQQKLVGRFVPPKEFGYEPPKTGIPEVAFTGRRYGSSPPDLCMWPHCSSIINI